MPLKPRLWLFSNNPLGFDLLTQKTQSSLPSNLKLSSSIKVKPFQWLPTLAKPIKLEEPHTIHIFNHSHPQPIITNAIHNVVAGRAVTEPTSIYNWANIACQECHVLFLMGVFTTVEYRAASSQGGDAESPKESGLKWGSAPRISNLFFLLYMYI